MAVDGEPELLIPVSVGELFDKISILEIKSERIAQPARLENIRLELHKLIEARDRFVPGGSPELSEAATALKAVNQLIWDAEDVIHGPDAATLPEADFVVNAKIAFDQNDVRSRIKRRINSLVGSVIVEEKSYPDFE